MDRKTCITVNDEICAAIADILDRHNLTLAKRSGTYGPEGATLRLTLEHKMADGEVNPVARDRWINAQFAIDETDLPFNVRRDAHASDDEDAMGKAIAKAREAWVPAIGKSFQYDSEEWRMDGWNNRAPKYPVKVTRLSDRSSRKMGVRYALNIIMNGEEI